MTMILADKIIEQRKKLGLSQEELADRLGVSRQAVSKWEGAQSTPDLGRILALSQIFGVSTDYLIKDELGMAEYIDVPDTGESVRRVSMAEAGAFLDLKETLAGRLSLAVFLCILSPICLLLLGGASEYGRWISEAAAGGIGIVALLLLVAIAVAIFLNYGMMLRPYEYLEKEVFETEYGVQGMVRERQNQYRGTYARRLTLGICTCILSVIPLMIASSANVSDFLVVAMLCLLLVIAGIGVILIVSSSVRWGAMEQLLQEGDYSKRNKANPALS